MRRTASLVATMNLMDNIEFLWYASVSDYSKDPCCHVTNTPRKMITSVRLYVSCSNTGIDPRTVIDQLQEAPAFHCNVIQGQHELAPLPTTNNDICTADDKRSMRQCVYTTVATHSWHGHAISVTTSSFSVTMICSKHRFETITHGDRMKHHLPTTPFTITSVYHVTCLGITWKGIATDVSTVEWLQTTRGSVRVQADNDATGSNIQLCWVVWCHMKWDSRTNLEQQT